MTERAAVLGEVLHARPANLLVTLANRFEADVRIVFGAKKARAKKILDVLRLGAKAGDTIAFVAEGGADAEEALAALCDLVARGFDADLVPGSGAAAVEGIAVGRAHVVAAASSSSATKSIDEALDVVARELEALIASLPRDEAVLFEPERPLLGELAPALRAAVASGSTAVDAVRAVTADAGATDLVHDLGTRLIAALTGESARSFEGAGETVVVAHELTPSLVAKLPPAVVGVLAGDATGKGYTSHAAILARGRGLPLLYADAGALAQVSDGDVVVIDTVGGARFWISPSDALVDGARARRESLLRKRADEEHRARASIPGLAVRVNVGSPNDRIPTAADGIGLVRTELVFADRTTAPHEDDQVDVLRALLARLADAGRAGAPIVVRLFDAGGDKPLAWLAPPAAAPDARGFELLLHHDAVLAAQLRALARARLEGDVRVLIPLVRNAADVTLVRTRIGDGVPVGAMIETPAAVDDVEAIADAADFLSIGTNDLTAAALGVDRAEAALAVDDVRVLSLVERIVAAAKARGRSVTVCGEMAATEAGARRLRALGVDGISVPPARVAPVKLSLADNG